jgi:hypothetical protein
MARDRFQVRYESSCYYWNFRLGGNNGRHLYCHLDPISNGKLEHDKGLHLDNDKKGSLSILKGKSWGDVTVRIGRVHGPNWGERITRQQFMKWIKVVLDLDRPLSCIETDHGTVILDETWSNRTYLKGLLLQGDSSKKFKFGYNFLDGKVSRDRQRLSSSKEEVKLLASIWESATQSKSAGALKCYVDMLLDRTKWDDVKQAEDAISQFLANSIWKDLLDRACK